MIPFEPNRNKTIAGAWPLSVSVVIPTYNGGKFINPALESVLQQTLQPLEIIVIDDGSTDDTRERLRIYEGRIRYYFQQNQGIGAARNAGINRANGNWIALLDSDDVWHPRKLEYQCAAIGSNPNMALVGTEHYFLDHDGTILSRNRSEIIRIDVDSIPLPQLIDPGVFCPSSAMIRKSSVEAVGGFSTQVQGSEDMLMWWSIGSAFPVCNLRAALTGYRIHSTSISHNYDTMIKSKKRALAIALSTLPPLQTQWRLRYLARARVLRDTSWEHHSGGDHCGAIADIFISIVNHLFAAQTFNRNTARLDSVKMLCRYLLSIFRKKRNT